MTYYQIAPIIYRDMKPANIMLKPDGNVVLIDFGMAREYKNYNRHDTVYLGTHGYAAPEQYNGNRQSDVRTDIYSLGVTLYHLVTGWDPCLPPYGINSVRSANAALSLQLDQIIQRCTKLQPELRFQTAKELNDALRTVRFTEGISAEFNSEVKKKSYKWLWFLMIIPVLMIAFTIVAVNGIREHAGEYANLIEGFLEDDVALYFEQEVYIGTPDERQYYTFTPERTGYYHIYSESGEVIPVIWLSDEDDNTIDEDNTTGEYAEFELKCKLYKDETYYIQTTLYDLDPSVSSTGSYWIYVDYME